jgi:hypothetical protein
MSRVEGCSRNIRCQVQGQAEQHFKKELRNSPSSCQRVSQVPCQRLLLWLPDLTFLQLKVSILDLEGLFDLKQFK